MNGASNFGSLAVAGVAAIALIAGAATILSPRLAAAGNVPHAQTNCNSPNPCSAFQNTGSGAGISGAAQNNSGIQATTTSNTLSTTKYGAFTIGNNAGIAAFDNATSFPDFNQAVLAISNHGSGVTAITESSEPNFTSGQYGVAGIDVSTQSLNNIGVYGYSGLDVGVFGSGHSIFGTGVFGTASDGGVGVFGNGRTNNGVGVFGNEKDGGIAVFGNAQMSTGTGMLGNAPDGIGVLGNSRNANAVVALSFGSAAETVRIQNSNTGPLIRGYNGSIEVMSLDNAGNFIVTGAVTQFGTPQMATRTSQGRRVVMYSAKQSVATVEDVGEGRLIDGEAAVGIDPAFAATMDSSQHYLVFITPQGDCGGLFVTEKTPSGFVVREHGGRSNVDFDYRIVAKPFGSHEARLPVWNVAQRSTPRGVPGLDRIDMKRLTRTVTEPRMQPAH